jgi:pimeloyl-ACP methyl ester carboxylesterase
MTSRPGRLGHWRSARAEQEFAVLEVALRREAWRGLCEGRAAGPLAEVDVETRFGPTRCYRWQGGGVPVVLLHGAGTSSLMWTPLLAHLCERSVYAIDTIGDPGGSVQRVPIRDAGEMTLWLGDVLDALGLHRVHLMAVSYGGWIAMHFGLRAPERVVTLTLVEPVVERVRPFFFVHGAACGIALLMPASIRHRAARRLHMFALATDDKRVRRWAFLGQARYRRGAPTFVPFSDTELGSIRTPTLVLLGERSQVHRSRRVADRVSSLMPHVDIELVPGAGHSLPVDQADDIAESIRAFLDREPSDAGRCPNTREAS